MSRLTQLSRIGVSQSIIENVFYSDLRVNRRNSLFDAQSQTNNSQRERSIYINTERDLIFWMKNVSDKLLKMIKMIKKKNRNLIENYNDQVDVIDEYLIKRNKYLDKKKTLQKENIALQNKAYWSKIRSSYDETETRNSENSSRSNSQCKKINHVIIRIILIICKSNRRDDCKH